MTCLKEGGEEEKRGKKKPTTEIRKTANLKTLGTKTAGHQISSQSNNTNHNASETNITSLRSLTQARTAKKSLQRQMFS